MTKTRSSIKEVIIGSYCPGVTFMNLMINIFSVTVRLNCDGVACEDCNMQHYQSKKLKATLSMFQ